MWRYVGGGGGHQLFVQDFRICFITNTRGKRLSPGKINICIPVSHKCGKSLLYERINTHKLATFLSTPCYKLQPNVYNLIPFPSLLRHKSEVRRR